MKDYNLFINHLTKLISFKTTASPSVMVNGQLAPFGEQNYLALHYFLDLAKDMGFETINYDNYIGEVYFGQGQEIGIIGHLDVVPTGIGWNTDPFTLTEKEGFLYARGSMDDKSAPLLCLFALKEIKDSGIKLNKKFRLFVGCNEETGWKDIDYLATKTTVPEYGFSPDANFPLSYAEKGISRGVFSLPKLKNFSNISGGKMENAVCDYATAQATAQGIDKTLLQKFGLNLLDSNIIESKGKAAHGSRPQLGKNALKPLFEYFLAMGENVQNVVDYLFYDKAKIFDMITPQGCLTMTPSMAYEKGDEVEIICDFRIPAPLSHADLVKKLDTFGIKYHAYQNQPTMMVDKDGWFVNALCTAFNKVTGKNEPPIAIGGSTFARAFKFGCAFGPSFKNYDANIHDANERISIQDLLTSYEIYKTTILLLNDSKIQ